MPVSATRLFSNKNRSISKFKGYRRKPSRLAVRMTPSVKGGEKFTAGKSVRAKSVKKPTPTIESTMPASHVNPNRMQGGNTSTLSPGDYEKAKAYQETPQAVKTVKPKKSMLKKFFGGRAGMRKAKFS